MFVSSHPHLLFPVPNKPHGFRGRKAPCLLFILKPAGSVNLDRGRLGLKPGVPQRPETEDGGEEGGNQSEETGVAVCSRPQ